MEKNQTKIHTGRVMEMEARFNRVSGCLENLEKALEAYAAVRENLRILADYYDGGQWREDFEADEAGAFPQDLPRGVLSEDGLYDVLQKNDGLKEQMYRLAGDSYK